MPLVYLSNYNYSLRDLTNNTYLLIFYQFHDVKIAWFINFFIISAQTPTLPRHNKFCCIKTKKTNISKTPCHFSFISCTNTFSCILNKINFIFLQIFFISSFKATLPNRSTAIIALVFLLINLEIFFGSIHKELGSTSTKIGFAPTYFIGRTCNPT